MKGVPTKPKKCAICGDMFVPAKPSTKICPKDHIVKCPICGNDMIWNITSKIKPCSRTCTKEQTRRFYLEKYGVEHPMQSKEVQQHHKQSMLTKYGVESPLQSQRIKNKAIQTNREKFGVNWALGNKEIKEKAKETMVERYGGETTLQSPILRSKVEKTCIERYGCVNPVQNKQIFDKITNTNFLRYGVNFLTQNPELYEKAKSHRIDHYGSYWTDEMVEKAKATWIEKYGVDNPSKDPEIKAKIVQTFIEKYGENYSVWLQRNIDPQGVVSNINRAFMSRLNEKGIEGEFQFTGIGRYRYDIVIPNQHILIELDPSYTHNAVGNHWSDKGLDKNYHKDKSLAAKDAGYQCIHIFDWDDWNAIIDMIAPRQSVYARNCQVYKLQPKIADEFLNNYHLQGTIRGQQLCLGLVRDGELLQVMTFGQPRYNKKYYAELLRLCTKPGVTVVGGASKLFTFATMKLGVGNIISYCDLSKFSGHVYEKLGMHLDHYTDPQEIWSKDDKKITANLLRQRGFDQMFGTNYGKGTDNNELMLADGWLPVYDCGQAVFTF